MHGEILLDALIPKEIVASGFGTRWDNDNEQLWFSAYDGYTDTTRSRLRYSNLSHLDQVAVISISNFHQGQRLRHEAVAELREGHMGASTELASRMVGSFLASIRGMPALAYALYRHKDILDDQREMRRLTGKRCMSQIETTAIEVQDNTLWHIQEIERRTEPYTVVLQGKDILVYPHVWAPSTETKLITDHMGVIRGQRVLDVTTGSGAVATIAALKGAEGIAIDINPAAVENASVNFQRHNVAARIHALQSNLFENIPSDEEGKFDLILCNPPYYGELKASEQIYAALYGADTFLQELFKGLRDHLKLNGKMLITYAEWADIESFKQLAEEYGYTIKRLERRASKSGRRLYQLFEVQPIDALRRY